MKFSTDLFLKALPLLMLNLLVLACSSGGGGSFSFEESENVTLVKGEVDFDSLQSKPRSKVGNLTIQFENLATGEITTVQLAGDMSFAINLEKGGDYIATAASNDGEVLKLMMSDVQENQDDVKVDVDTTAIAIYMESVYGDNLIGLDTTEFRNAHQDIQNLSSQANDYLTNPSSSESSKLSALSFLAIKERVKEVTQSGNNDLLLQRSEIKTQVTSDSELQKYTQEVIKNVIASTNQTVYIQTSNGAISFATITEVDSNSDTITSLSISISSVEDQVNEVNNSPVAKAGEDQTVRVGYAVELNASGSNDPNNDIITYQWTQISGNSVTLSTNISGNAMFVVPSTNTSLVFRLTVGDGSLSATDEVTISVENEAPVSDAGADQQVVASSTVSLDGSGSYDVNGETLTYFWSQLDGATVSFLSSNSLTSFTAPGQRGQLIFQLTVSDGELSSSSNVTVDILNQGPVISAGNNQIVDPGSTVLLEGDDSTDPDGDTLTYTWSQSSGEVATLSSNNVANPSFTAPTTSGNLVFELKISDGEFLSTGNVVIEVPNVAPVSQAGSNQQVVVGDQINLDGSASYDVNEDNLTYTWAGNNGFSANTSTTSLTAGAKGVLTFELTVSDGSLSSTDNVEVVVLNTAPIISAGNDQQVEASDMVTLSSSISDPDGDTTSLFWTQNSGESVTLSSNYEAAPTFTAPAVKGDLVFTLTVNDGEGESTDSVTIEVLNQAPIANAGTNLIAYGNDSVELDGSGSSDPDGDSLNYSWQQLSGTDVSSSFSLILSASPSFSAPTTTGNLMFELTVSDGVDIDTNQVQVEILNSAPVADAGGNQMVGSSSNVLLSANNTIDVNEDALNYSWKQISGNTVTLSSNTSANLNFIATSYEAELVFELSVDDGKLSSTDNVTVSVTMLISSDDFVHGGVLPDIHAHQDSGAAGATNISPHFLIENVPGGTVECAIIMEDLTFPGLHWAMYDIATSDNIALPQGDAFLGNSGGISGFGVDYYIGPFPPSGDTHNYRFTFYALATDYTPTDTSNVDVELANLVGTSDISATAIIEFNFTSP